MAKWSDETYQEFVNQAKNISLSLVEATKVLSYTFGKAGINMENFMKEWYKNENK